VRVVVAAVLAVAADAVLVAQHLLKLGAHLVTALARLHEHKSSPSGDARSASITPDSRSKNTAHGTYLSPEASW
jgi:hypothetical protein